MELKDLMEELENLKSIERAHQKFVGQLEVDLTKRDIALKAYTRMVNLIVSGDLDDPKNACLICGDIKMPLTKEECKAIIYCNNQLNIGGK